VHRWNLHDKPGERVVYSPDWADDAKVQRRETITWYSRLDKEQPIWIAEDELT
jgi:hypothetical protein